MAGMGNSVFKNGAAKRNRGRSVNTRRGENVCVSENFELVKQSETEQAKRMARLRWI